ncbi:DNA-3-methyladenine glycosylase I [Spiractinospora alimapuensis]|uniref:DNA-3-methyladenine glycosylase I n=1 Tax=Spiractinospora alimapuensis TaxID=2820884 RepID=UPI001F30F3C3|nr:DNA-3-methyladenine glycosylase I [Spiractinospora alimapuensis]QVQ54054.1 DNA-3-methyladenine glycosylase I [Spiractinospora alimapuensis]
MTTAGAPVGADGRARCDWALNSDDELRYHDTEWALPVRDDQGMFERISLEAFQAGLSWRTVLVKRPAFREVFHDFAIAKVAAFDADDVARLLDDARIIRSRAKIEAVIANARAALELPGGIARLVWSFQPESAPVPVSAADVPPTTPDSVALSKELKRRGFRFVGPTTAYATMQAAGLVNDHLRDCWRRPGVNDR